MTDILVAQHAKDVPRKLSFTLRDALCDYFLANSKFYKEENQDPMQEAISRVVALAGAALRKKTQKGSLATYGPNRPKKTRILCVSQGGLSSGQQENRSHGKSLLLKPKVERVHRSWLKFF